MPEDNSADKKGVATEPILTTGHEKNHITMCLAALGNGHKLLPLMVFKDKQMPKELQNICSMMIEMSSNGWMQGLTILAWIEKCWGKIAFSRCFHIWDSFCINIMNKAEQHTKEINTVMDVIPGGCT